MPRPGKFLSALIVFLILIGMIPIVYFASLELGAAETSATASGNPVSIDITESGSTFDRYVENVAFGIGEHLEFDVNYGFINAGTATMSVERLIEYEKRPCYLVTTTAHSNSFFTTFYKVDDRVESIVDALGLFSWRFEKKLQEGKYKAHRTFSFDQRNHTAVYNDDTTTIPPFVHDALSVFYYIRTQPLEEGQSVYVDHYNDGKLYALEVKVLEKETITVTAGTFECLVVEPLLQSVGVFKHEGRLKVWLTDDKLRLPVRMRSKIIVGSITVELTDYKLGEIESF